MGSQADRTGGNAAGSRDVADCGTNGAGSATASRPHGPTDKPGGPSGERSRQRNPGLQCGEIKPQTSD